MNGNKFTFLWADGQFVQTAQELEDLTFERADQFEYVFTTHTVIRDGQVRFTEVLSHD